MSESLVSIRRLEDLLKLSERDCYSQSLLDSEEKPQKHKNGKVIVLEDVTAHWQTDLSEQVPEKTGSDSKTDNNNAVVPVEKSDPSETFFTNLNLEVEKSAFLGVIGPVGSGKSSFLSIFLNESPLFARKISNLPFKPDKGRFLLKIWD